MRRPNGTGTITKMSGARRKPYAVRVPVRDRKGRVVQKYLSYHATMRDAMEALDAYRYRFSVQQAPPPDALDQTLTDAWEGWKKKVHFDTKLSYNTQKTYKSAWNSLSALHEFKIRNLGIDQWQAAIDQLEAAGKSKSAIEHACLIAKSLSRYALERDWIQKDYSQFIAVPKVEAKVKKGALTEEQIAALAQMAAQGNQDAASVLVLCYTGFRASEFLALSPASYDRENGILIGGGKTAAGKNRIVPVHPAILPYIDAWAGQNRKRLYTNDSGQAIGYETYRKIVCQIMAQIGCPDATAHWCRHTMASRLKRAGADPMIVKLILGHATGDITERYTHVTVDQLRENVLLLPMPLQLTL